MSHPLPIAFVERVKADPLLGNSLLEALEQAAPTAIRLNPEKQSVDFPGMTALSWSEHGFLLAERPKFVFDPLFHAGCYYPQEAGSQLLDAVLRQLELPENPLVLDLCAAPGGKSTLIASFLGKNGLLVSNEVIQSRSRILKENLTKWGTYNAIVTNNDPEDFGKLPALFDCIVVDAPCSGEGMFRKDPAARNEWSEQNVELCAARQRRIVMDCWNSLKEGGFLVYSTCTFNTLENEENVQWFLKQGEAELVKLELPWAVSDRNTSGWYALPGKLDTEGFYITVLRKTIAVSTKRKPLKQVKLQRVKDEKELKAFAQLDEKNVVQWNDFVFAIPADFTETIFFLHHHLRVIKLGTELGELTRKGLIPHEALALDPSTRSEQLPTIALTQEQALAYLHGDTFPLEGKHGFAMVTFHNEPLGWIKHLGNRFNNLYPKEWRIRMDVTKRG